MNHRKKRIYGGVLILGAVALLVDRVVISGGPSSARAHQAQQDAAQPLGVDGEFGPVVSVEASPFPDVSDVADEDVMRDIFSPDGAMAAVADGSFDAPGTLGGADRSPDQTGSFEEVHRLSAVMLGGKDTMAIVDGAWLRIGDRVDDCELIEITGNSATFRCPGGRVMLSVGPQELNRNSGS